MGLCMHIAIFVLLKASSKQPAPVLREPLQFHIVMCTVSQAIHHHAAFFSVITTLPSLYTADFPSSLASRLNIQRHTYEQTGRQTCMHVHTLDMTYTFCKIPSQLVLTLDWRLPCIFSTRQISTNFLWTNIQHAYIKKPFLAQLFPRCSMKLF